MWRSEIFLKPFLVPVLLLTASLLFALFYYKTDLSDSFENHFTDIQQTFKTAADSYISTGSIPLENFKHLPGDFSPFDPQRPALLLMEDGEVKYSGSAYWEPLIIEQKDEKFSVLSASGYQLAVYSSSGGTASNRTAQILIPLLADDSLRQTQLHKFFSGRFTEVDYLLVESDGYIVPEVQNPVRSRFLKKLSGSLFILFFIGLFLCVVLFEKGKRGKRMLNPRGMIPVVLALFFARLSLELEFIQHLTSVFPLFDSATMGWGDGRNLGHLLIDFGLFLTVAFYLIRIPLLNKRWNPEPGLRALMSVGGYFLIILGWILFVWVVGQLILNSSIHIDLEEVFKMDRYSFLTLTGILMYLLAQFLINLKLGETLHQLKIPMGNRILSIAAAALISLPIFLAFNQAVSPFPFYLSVFLFLFLLDLFTEKPVTGGYYWALLWMLVLSGCTAALLYKFTLDNDLEKRVSIAEEIYNIAKGDGSVEQNLYRMADELAGLNEDHYEFALYHNNRKVWANSPVYASAPDPDFMSNSSGKIERKGTRTEYVKQSEENGLQILVGKYSTDLFKPVSLFSYVFFLMAIFIFLILLINEKLRFLPPQWSIAITGKPSLRRKIQILIISLTLISFVLVGLITVYFFYLNNEREQEFVFSEHLLHLENVFEEDNQSVNPLMSLRELALDRKVRLAVYDQSGMSITRGAEFGGISGGMPTYLPVRLRESVKEGSQRVRGINYQHPNLRFQVSELGADASQYFLVFGPDPVYRQQTTAFTDFLGSLLNVYFFLFILSGSLAFAFSDGITQPLLRIRDSLNKVRLGKENEPIEWEHDDELGELIRDYNRIIKEIDDSAKLLAITEREVAWREMAKQVAHEIKNPLTPMKLSIQHLQFASKRGGDNLQPLIERTSNTLIEQIDNLSRIASEFSTFAKMPEAMNEKINLNELVSRAHDLFRNRDDMDISLTVPIDEIYVYADKNYLIRVLTNLVKNSIQAIPMNRRGDIKIKLYRKEEFAYLRVSDNGTGIPDEMREKVFKPNFTSKNSGTGLGLAICHNIVESFHGRIYFETQPDEGTTFFVELPMMRTEDKLHPTKRVEL